MKYDCLGGCSPEKDCFEVTLTDYCECSMILVLFSLTHKRRLHWAQQGRIVLHRVLQRAYFQSHSCLIKIFVPLLSEQLQISRNWFSKPTLCWHSVPRYLRHHASVKFLVAVFGSSPFFSFASVPFPFPFDAQFTLLVPCRRIWWILIDSDDLAFGSALFNTSWVEVVPTTLPFKYLLILHRPLHC